MEQLIEVYDQAFDTPRQIRVRTVTHYAKDRNDLPKCAWCRLRLVRPLCAVIQRGFTIDLVITVGYCDSCGLGTIVHSEVERETESEVE